MISTTRRNAYPSKSNVVPRRNIGRKETSSMIPLKFATEKDSVSQLSRSKWNWKLRDCRSYLRRNGNFPATMPSCKFKNTECPSLQALLDALRKTKDRIEYKRGSHNRIWPLKDRSSSTINPKKDEKLKQETISKSEAAGSIPKTKLFFEIITPCPSPDPVDVCAGLLQTLAPKDETSEGVDNTNLNNNQDDDEANESDIHSDSGWLRSKRKRRSSSGHSGSRSRSSKKPSNMDGAKWVSLEHKGPVFADPYIPLPSSVKFFYDGKRVQLSEAAEEVAGFYAKMLDHEYTKRKLFNDNFFKDWRNVMTRKEQSLITNLKKCDFTEMHEHFEFLSQERKNMSKEEKLELRERCEQIKSEYGSCKVDGQTERIANFKIEPPGLFRGRGDHPKQGMVKMRVLPEDVTINCSKGKIPKPPPGHNWREVQHDNTVTWLCSWKENISGSTKYVWLSAASKLKGDNDFHKYEVARDLDNYIDEIRENYQKEWQNADKKIQQRAVALYFIDKLALRAGNEKDEESADTVGCCSLRVEHITLHDKMDGQTCVVEFYFLGKDSIRYNNIVAVDERVFKALQSFVRGRKPGENLFKDLNTRLLNEHLQTLMDGLTAKVFRTYNASRTLEEQLHSLTREKDPIAAKILSYNRANRQVAILCNHHRAVPKNFDQQMGNLEAKINAKEDQVETAREKLKVASDNYKAIKTKSAKADMKRKQKKLDTLIEQLNKLRIQHTDKNENKDIALGTSKLNYLDPRITIAWCKMWEVPIEKIYNKTQREKFAWAMDVADENFRFADDTNQ